MCLLCYTDLEVRVLAQRLLGFIKKHWDVVIYLLFGIFVTITNYVVYLPLYNIVGLSATLSNGVAWVASVLVAFLTNKPFVFKSNDWSAKVVVPEILKFVGCRIGSGIAETAILFVTVDLLQWNGNVFKLLTSVLVVILNYIGSKLLVFKSEDQ